MPTYSDAFDALTRFYREKSNGQAEEIDLTGEEDGSEADRSGSDGEGGVEDKDPIGLAAGLPCGSSASSTRLFS